MPRSQTQTQTQTQIQIQYTQMIKKPLKRPGTSVDAVSRSNGKRNGQSSNRGHKGRGNNVLRALPTTQAEYQEPANRSYDHQAVEKRYQQPVSPKTQAERRKIKRRFIKARQHTFLTLYSSGMTPEQIAVKHQMTVNHVKRDLTIAIEDLIDHYAKPNPQQTFVRYASFQFDIVKQLQNMIDVFLKDPVSKQYSATTSALRTQSDIYDKVLDKGIEFGVIEKKKATASLRQEPQDLRASIRIEIKQLTRLLDEIDEADQVKALSPAQSLTQQPRLSVTGKRLGRPPAGELSDKEKIRRSHHALGNHQKTIYITKPIRNEYGIVRSIPDWKYRKQAWSEGGLYRVSDPEKTAGAEQSVSQNQLGEPQAPQAHNQTQAMDHLGMSIEVRLQQELDQEEHKDHKDLVNNQKQKVIDAEYEIKQKELVKEPVADEPKEKDKHEHKTSTGWLVPATRV